MAIAITFPTQDYEYAPEETVEIRGTGGPCTQYRLQDITRRGPQAKSPTPRTWGARLDQQDRSLWVLTLDPRPDPGYYQITVFDAEGSNASQTFYVLGEPA